MVGIWGKMKKQNKKQLLLREYKKLEEKLGGFIPKEELEKSLKNKLNEKELEKIINELVEEKILYIPRKGFLQRFETVRKSEELEQSEKISDLIAQIAGLTVKIQNLEYQNEELTKRLKEIIGMNKKFKADVVNFIMEH